jgi:hypothetical protein
MAEHQAYRALWARHYPGLDSPDEFSQAFDVWQSASERAALNEAAAAGQALSLLPQAANAADAAYQETLRSRLKSGKGVYSGTWLVNDTQILVPSVVPGAQKWSVTISCVALGGFADRLKNCQKRFPWMRYVRVDSNPCVADSTPRNNPARENSPAIGWRSCAAK